MPDDQKMTWDELASENTKLKAENTKLRNLANCRDSMVSELENLRTSLQAENARLRALIRLAIPVIEILDIPTSGAAKDIIGSLRAALKSGPAEQESGK